MIYLDNINGVDITILVFVILFIAFVIGYLIYKKVKYGTIEECDARASSRDLIAKYHKQKLKEEKIKARKKKKAEKLAKMNNKEGKS